MSMIEDQLIEQLRAELDLLTEGVGTTPPPFDLGMARVVSIADQHHRRLSGVVAVAVVALVVGGAGLLLVRRDGGAAGSTDSTPNSAATVVQPALTTTERATAATVSTSVAVIQDVLYFAIGESVMLGAKPMLDGRGIITAAEVSAGPQWMLDSIRQFKTKHRITNGVVVQLGTNGTVTREEYDAVLAELSDLNLVAVMTVKADKPWIAGNNEIIRSLPTTHPNVKVVDWEARSVEIADHLSASDGGIHLADATAQDFYTKLILEGFGLPM